MLLVTAGLCVGESAWADGNKRTLEANDYSSETSDWTPGDWSSTVKSGTAGQPTKYVNNYHGKSGPRSGYKDVSLNYAPGSGYTTSGLTTKGYNIEFDFSYSAKTNNGSGNHQGQFVLSTGNPTGNTYVVDEATSLFSFSYPAVANNSLPDNFYINDLASSTGTSLSYSTYASVWLHVKLVVTTDNVAYTINKYSDGSAVASGNKTVSGLLTLTRFYACLGRGSDTFNFANLDIYDYTESITVNAPTFTFKKVDGAKRVYTLTNPNGAGTLYYTTSAADEAPAKGDAAYTSSTNTSLDVEYNENGKYYAYVLHSGGSATSDITSQSVTAGELTLTAPTFKIVDMVEAADGYYYPQVSFSSDNSSLEGGPIASFNVAGPYTFTGIGYIDVTASAEGYTSSTSRYTVSTRYTKTKTIDFGALTASDFDAEVWTSGTGVPRDYWTNRAAAIPADVPNRKLTHTSSTQGDPDNSAVVDGITISNYYQRPPEFCIGYGMYTPYAALSGSSNNMNFKVNGATAEDIIVYNGWNNYGSGTFNTVQAGDASFGLYRYDTMLRTIKVYSPEDVTIIGELDCTSNYRSAFSDDIVVANGSAKKVTFKNYGSGTGDQYYKNWVLDINYDGSLVTTVRSDWYAFGVGSFTYGYTYSSDGGATADNTNIWSTWFADNAASDVELTLSHVDGKLYITGTMTKDSKVYYMNYTYGDGSQTDDFTMNLSIDHSWIEMGDIEDASVVTTPVHPTNVAVTMGTNGYATYANNVYPLDLTSAKAYKAAVDGSKVKFTLFGQAVPAGTGMLVEGTVSGMVNLPIADASSAVADNEFLVNASGAVFDAVSGYNYFALIKDSNPLTFGTFAPSTLAFPANKTYLKVAASTGARLLAVFGDDETTGISQMESGKLNIENAVYNLNGQRVAQPTKGLYIVGGKKVMMK